MIQIKSLNKFFNKGRQNELHVLNNVELTLPEQGMVAIFGKSGCGKTTLLNVIGGLDNFAGGSLSVDGRDIRKSPDLIRNESMGYIFQNYNLQKNESCFDNVAAALRLCGMTDEAEIEARVMAALTNVDMARYRKRTPDTLSGGQQQRIAIARAIVKNPRIILADEPTGNLDEENTLMIMNLLRRVANDHLVLLVTHEANLVDYYCNTVIELKDGSVAGIRHNTPMSGGYQSRNKNAVYLGELSHSKLEDTNAEIEYYGDAPVSPIRLTIVNHGGKMYVQVNTDKVQILDETSEVKLLHGVYEARENTEPLYDFDMSALPPVQGTRFGRLFNLRQSMKSGYLANFKKAKRGKNILTKCMALFAVAAVVVTGVFGTSLGNLKKVSDSYNHNVFYLYTPDGDVSDRLEAAAADPASAIDSYRLTYGYLAGDISFKFNTGFFETFSLATWGEDFKTHGVFLNQSLAASYELVAGKRDSLAVEEILISTKVADALLESSSLAYIDEYRDLLGMTLDREWIDEKPLRVAGVVRSSEPAVYLTELGMAKRVLSYSDLPLRIAEEESMSVADGQVIFICNPYSGNIIIDENGNEKDTTNAPALGSSIRLQGTDFTVSQVKRMFHDYRQWLKNHGISKVDRDPYLKELFRKGNASLFEDPAVAAYESALANMTPENYPVEYAQMQKDYGDSLQDWNEESVRVQLMWLVPALVPTAQAYNDYYSSSIYPAESKFIRQNYFLYDEYYYAEYDAFASDYRFFSDNLYLWISETKGDPYAKYLMDGPSEYYIALTYKAANGSYPSRDSDIFNNMHGENSASEALRKQYEEEFRSTQASSYRFEENLILVSEADYIALSKRTGENTDFNSNQNGNGGMGKDLVMDHYVYSDGSGNVVMTSPSSGGSSTVYTVIHSSDPEKTTSYLRERFGDIEAPNEYTVALLCPSDIYDQMMEDSGSDIFGGLLAMVLILAIMSVCMFFIMRSSLMNRIKEVGIYRAIGVSKKNLIFKFLMESLVLTLLTVVIGHLLASAFIFTALSLSPFIETYFYYPVWLAGSLLGILCLLCLICGTLPILSLLRKTPSQILAKYDI